MRLPTVAQAKVLLLLLGVGLAVGQTMLAWERGAPPTEVLAPLLYVPIFAGAIFFGLTGGLLGSLLASGVYLLVLLDQSSTIGTRLFVGLLVNRVVTFVFYGILVSAGTRYVEGRLTKLELYDQIDDDTNLYNGAFFLEDSDLEVGRADRYQSIFSVAELRVGRQVFGEGSRRAYKRWLRDFGRGVRSAVRAVDRPARIVDADSDRFLIILPETGAEGSQILASRLDEHARRFLRERGLAGDGELNGQISARALTFPDDREALAALRREVADLDQNRRTILEEAHR